jgi:hypothetical protein
MRQKDWLLLAIGDYIEPIQLQKTLFKFAREAPVPTNQRYAFVPYNWGPMAKQVYPDLEELQEQGLVEARPTGMGWSGYSLTTQGLDLAYQLREGAPRELLSAIDEKRAWVLDRPFSKLLRDVYAQYPEMAKKSLFKP